MVRTVKKKSFESLDNWDSWSHTPKIFSFLSRLQWRCVRTLFKTDTDPACNHLSPGGLTLLPSDTYKGNSNKTPSHLASFLPSLLLNQPRFLVPSCASPPKWTCLFLPIQYILFFQQRSSPFPHLTKPYRHTLIKKPWAMKSNLTQAVKKGP